MANLTVSVANAPSGAETLAVSWIRVDAPGLGVMPAAVARPSGAGPFPAILLLHGSHGFAHEYVRLAQDLARTGLHTVAAGWFREGTGNGVRFITPIVCPELPPAPDPLSPEATETVGALLQALRTLPDARPDRIGLFGHSRGGGAALNYIVRAAGVQAAVLNSARYPSQLTALAPELSAPLLMLHGTADSVEDGGTELTNIEMARDFERAALASGKLVEAVYYEGGRHNDIFDSSVRYHDAVRRMSAFLLSHLGNSASARVGNSGNSNGACGRGD
jgi:dienelactone hydrolase